MLLQALEYPSGSTPSNSKPNIDPRTAIKKARIDSPIKSQKTRFVVRKSTKHTNKNFKITDTDDKNIITFNADIYLIQDVWSY